MRIFSTFSGIGGFEIGIDRAYGKSQAGPQVVSSSGHSTSSSVGVGDRGDEPPKCVGYSEIDKYAIKVYEKQFPGVKNYGDITKINAEELPEFDCLVGGFPCQAFSIAGKRRGFEDTRGTLFFDLARILNAKRPRLFVFENVKGLLSHDNGNTFKTIIATIDELGYDCQWQVLNSKNFGVPQNRERVIIVGHLRGTPRPEVFPIGGETGSTTANEIVTVNKPVHSSRRVYSERSIAPTLKARARQDETGMPLVLVPEATKKGYAEAKVGDSINLQAIASKTRRGRVGSGQANTLDTTMQQYTLTSDSRIRRLTPVECERLQAFPDNWTKYGSGEVLIPDTQRYKMCGNAVTTNVIQAVFERIFESDF